MVNLPHSSAVPVLDVRQMSCPEKHPHIIKTWLELPVGGAFVVRNHHAPERIRQQIEAAWPGALGWEVVAVTPEDVSVQLSKLRSVSGSLELPTNPCHSI